MLTKATSFALLLVFSWPAAAAEKPRTRSKQEVLTCKLGTEDRHARMAVALLNGKINSFAYYSKWDARTCSIDMQRGGAYGKWSDQGSVTTVNAEKGIFVIERQADGYHFQFRDVDRERYCGMDGLINGWLTVRKGRDQCALEGIMEEAPQAPNDTTASVEPPESKPGAPAATGSEARPSAPALAN